MGYYFLLFIQTLFTYYCHVNSVMFVFWLKTGPHCLRYFYAFLFDVRNLIFQYLIYVRYLIMCTVKSPIYIIGYVF